MVVIHVTKKIRAHTTTTENLERCTKLEIQNQLIGLFTTGIIAYQFITVPLVCNMKTGFTHMQQQSQDLTLLLCVTDDVGRFFSQTHS